MASNKTNESASYKIGYIFGNVVFKLIAFVFGIVWGGIVKACIRLKALIIVYICLVAFLIASVTLLDNYTVMTAIILAVVLVMGLWEYAKEYPTSKNRKYYKKLFQKIGLQEADGTTPYFMYEKELNRFTTIIAFRSLIPSGLWVAKKELIQLHMNRKIVDIRTDNQDQRISYLVIKTEELPSKIDWNDSYLVKTGNVLNIGVSCYGMMGIELETYPHTFIAGETGSGKSNILKCLIHQSLLKHYEVVLIDFKRGVSFSQFSNAIEVCYEYDQAIKILETMVEETKRRLDRFRIASVDNLKDYNSRSGEHLERIIIFIDELAELLKTRDKSVSGALTESLETLTRLSRATGIHLIMGLQRPDSTIVNGQIKNNVSYRVCGRFVDIEPSRIMLASDIACTLPPTKGRFIVKDEDFHEVQCFYFSNGNQSAYQQRERPPVEKLTDSPRQDTDDFDFDFNDISKT